MASRSHYLALHQVHPSVIGRLAPAGTNEDAERMSLTDQGRTSDSVKPMPKHIALVDDLRQTAVTSAALAITAMTRSDATCLPLAAVEAGIDAALPFLADALSIQDALAAATESATAGGQEQSRLIRRLWRRADRNPYVYLRLLDQYGMLSLRTVQLDDDWLSVHGPVRSSRAGARTDIRAGRRSRRYTRKRGRFAAPARRRR
jgi:hypothetical protein